ncbi:MAG: LysM domain-containing protein [Burkholderiaceae bacterium]
MTFRLPLLANARPAVALNGAALALAVLACAPSATQAATYPITSDQRSTAQQVASRGVPLSELAPNAPDTYTVKRGDTLWAISGVFLKRPWHWPELWGMNLDQIHNPHLIYPGQLLVLEKIDGMARLKLGTAIGGTDNVKLSPSIRSESASSGAIASIPMNLIGPFLTDALVFNSNQLATAPRIVATQEGRVLLGRGDKAYVNGEVGNTRSWQVFREPKPLVDPDTKEVLGYEARYVGSAEHVQDGEARPGAESRLSVPSTFVMTSTREDASVGDRLAPDSVRDFAPFVPHAPSGPMNGAVVSLYGDALSAGINQVVSLNRGARDGVERGNVLTLWHEGAVTHDKSAVDKGSLIKLPDERIGSLFVFRVFDRVSYALILEGTQPVVPGDRFSTPSP